MVPHSSLSFWDLLEESQLLLPLSGAALAFRHEKGIFDCFGEHYDFAQIINMPCDDEDTQNTSDLGSWCIKL